MRAVAALAWLSSFTFALGPFDGCKTKLVGGHDAAADACTGTPPVCYTAAPGDCCVDPSTPAECGPKDAPVGTHLKWVCPDSKMTLASECRGIGASCVPEQHGAAIATQAPHAVVPLVVVDLDASAPDAAAEAGAKKKKR